jgi:hypothetical protein
MACAFVLLFCSSAPAEELWVRNRPFQGVVRGTGGEMMVEMTTFLQLMEIEARDQGDVVLVGGFSIPIETSGNVRLVPLRDVVDAAGLRLSQNPALGTVDVRAASAGTGSRGNWTPDETTRGGTAEKKGSKTDLEGTTFKVSVPGHLAVVSEADYLKSDEKSNAKTSSLNPDDADPKSTETAFLVATEAGPSQGILTFSIVPGLPSEIDPNEEERLLKTVIGGVLSRGGTLTSKTQLTNIAGKRFHQFQYKSLNESGDEMKNEVFLHFSPKNQVAFLALIEAPKRRFNRAAPQLRLVIRNLRVK